MCMARDRSDPNPCNRRGWPLVCGAVPHLDGRQEDQHAEDLLAGQDDLVAALSVPVPAGQEEQPLDDVHAGLDLLLRRRLELPVRVEVQGWEQGPDAALRVALQAVARGLQDGGGQAGRRRVRASDETKHGMGEQRMWWEEERW